MSDSLYVEVIECLVQSVGMRGSYLAERLQKYY